MHTHGFKNSAHDHAYHVHNVKGERGTHWVIGLTMITMIVEISAGYLFGSMALLADGWHMGTHAVALGITALAYHYARKHSANPEFSFGTGKVGVLGGFTSAVVLAVVALFMGVESFKRLIHPQPIHFNEAIAVAVVGLIVNIVSVFLLQNHSTEPAGGHTHPHDGQADHNLRAAYLHVMADALTSLLAIIALFSGKLLGWLWMDSLMGMVGGLVIMKWAHGLLIDAGRILLDRGVTPNFIADVKAAIESEEGNNVTDIHIWHISPRHQAVILSITAPQERLPDHYKQFLSHYPDIVHLTIEVNPS